MRYTFNFQQIASELVEYRGFIERRINKYFESLLILLNEDADYLNKKITCIDILEDKQILQETGPNNCNAIVMIHTILDSLGGVKVNCRFVTSKGDEFEDSFITIISSYDKKYKLFDYIFKKKELEPEDLLSLSDFIINHIVYNNKARLEANAKRMRGE